MLDDFEIARRSLFLLASAERQLGIAPQPIPMSARFENVLTAAMHSPLSVQASEYRLFYRLLSAINGSDVVVTPQADKPTDKGTETKAGQPARPSRSDLVADTGGRVLASVRKPAAQVIANGVSQPASETF